MSEYEVTIHSIETRPRARNVTFHDVQVVPVEQTPEGAVLISELMAGLVEKGFVGRWPYRMRVTPKTSFSDVVSRVEPGIYIEA